MGHLNGAPPLPHEEARTTFTELARLCGEEPRTMLRRYVEHLSHVVEAWSYDDTGAEESALLKMTNIHLENALHCLDVLARPLIECGCAPGDGCASNETPAAPSSASQRESRQSGTPPEPGSNGAASSGGRQPYVAPTLRKLGTIAELTRGPAASPLPRRPGFPHL